MRRGLTALALLAIAATGCSDAMTPRAARQLDDGVSGVRASTLSGDRAEAEFSVNALRSSVEGMVTRGALDAEKAEQILAALAEVEAALDHMPTTTTTTLPPVDDDEDEDEGGKGKGKGRGKAFDADDD
jgi:hypothetical protein